MNSPRTLDVQAWRSNVEPSWGRKLNTHLVAIVDGQPQRIDYIRDLAGLPLTTTVLVPWVGQWRTDTLITTAADILNGVPDHSA